MKDVFIGRCAECRTPARFVARPVYPVAKDLFGKPIAQVQRKAPWGLVTSYGGKILIRCLCGGVATFTLIQGKKNRKMPCGKSCERATSDTCECSCAGKNHGIAHAPRAAFERNVRRAAALRGGRA